MWSLSGILGWYLLISVDMVGSWRWGLCGLVVCLFLRVSRTLIWIQTVPEHGGNINLGWTLPGRCVGCYWAKLKPWSPTIAYDSLLHLQQTSTNPAQWVALLRQEHSDELVRRQLWPCPPQQDPTSLACPGIEQVWKGMASCWIQSTSSFCILQRFNHLQSAR